MFENLINDQFIKKIAAAHYIVIKLQIKVIMKWVDRYTNIIT